MDELMQGAQSAPEEIKLPPSVPEMYLGTVREWNSETGIVIQLDGQTERMTKRYKMLNVSHAPKVGDRVLIAKISGTYLILGDITLPQPYYSFGDLPSDATLASAVQRINSICRVLRSVGILWQPQS